MDKLRKADGWTVQRIAHRDGRAFITANHYARGAANTSTLAAGLIDPSGRLVGVTLWMPPRARRGPTPTGCSVAPRSDQGTSPSPR